MILSFFIITSSVETWTEVPPSDYDASGAFSYILSKQYLLFPEVIRNPSTQTFEKSNSDFIRYNESTLPNAVSVIVQVREKIKIIKVQPQYVVNVRDVYQFNDVSRLDQFTLNKILDCLEDYDGFNTEVDSLIEYRTKTSRGTQIHIVFYDKKEVMNSVEYLLDVGTNPSRIISHYQDILD